MKITVIGAGAMGGSTVEGLLKQEATKVEITVSDPASTTRERFSRLGVAVTADNAAAVRGADVVMVFVKPWLVETVLSGIRDELDLPRQLLVVVAAGVPSSKINEWLSPTTPLGPKERLPEQEHPSPITHHPFFLAIPNIAISELSSMTFLVPVGASAEQTATIKGLFDAMGSTLITDEQHLAAGTTLASCGIAYAMRYIRAASEGGVELGFKADDAKQIVMQTVEGAVKLLAATGLHPEAAIDMVTTPGGVTIKGLNEMEHAGFTSAVIRGLKAGVK